VSDVSSPSPQPAVIAKPPVVALPKGQDTLARGFGVVALGVALAACSLFAWQQGRITAQQNAVKPASAAELTALQQRVTTLAAALDALAEKPAPAVMATQSNPQEEDQLHNALTELASLRDKLNNMQQGIAGAKEVQQQITQLKNDIAVANTAISGMRGNVQKMSDSAQQAALAETATRAQMVSYMQLRGAAAAATPFVAELQNLCSVAKGLSAVTAECAKLENSSHAGVATLPMLQSRFGVMAGAAERAVAMADAKTWTDRLKVSFDEVVKIRKIDETGATSTSKLVHDAAAALQRGNLADAMEKVSAMPEQAQKELQEWSQDARARLELEAGLIRIGAALGQVPAVVTPAQTGEAAQP